MAHSTFFQYQLKLNQISKSGNYLTKKINQRKNKNLNLRTPSTKNTLK